MSSGSWPVEILTAGIGLRQRGRKFPSDNEIGESCNHPDEFWMVPVRTPAPWGLTAAPLYQLSEVADLQEKLKDYLIGILRIEKADMESLSFTLTVAEDLDCSGLPVSDETVCEYDEGFIAGILGKYTGREFKVKEVDCWASGDRVCRFNAMAEDN